MTLKREELEIILNEKTNQLDSIKIEKKISFCIESLVKVCDFLNKSNVDYFVTGPTALLLLNQEKAKGYEAMKKSFVNCPTLFIHINQKDHYVPLENAKSVFKEGKMKEYDKFLNQTELSLLGGLIMCNSRINEMVEAIRVGLLRKGALISYEYLGGLNPIQIGEYSYLGLAAKGFKVINKAGEKSNYLYEDKCDIFSITSEEYDYDSKIHTRIVNGVPIRVKDMRATADKCRTFFPPSLEEGVKIKFDKVFYRGESYESLSEKAESLAKEINDLSRLKLSIAKNAGASGIAFDSYLHHDYNFEGTWANPTTRSYNNSWRIRERENATARRNSPGSILDRLKRG